MAMTGNAGYKRKCLKVGMDDFITKPYTLDRLHDKIKELTVKVVNVRKAQNQIILEKEMPMDEKHLKELRELRKKGLTKLCIHGIAYDFTCVVDERVQNKISYDLIGKKQELSEFLDRSEDKPGVCHLYKSNFMVNTKYILPEELDEYVKDEEDVLKKCKNKVVMPLDD